MIVDKDESGTVMNPTAIQSRIQDLKREASAARERLRREQQALKEAQQILIDTEYVQAKTQALAQAIQQQAHTQIAGVVTLCLQAVFGEAYAFRIRFERKRGKTEAQLLLIKEGQEIEDPINEDSGGVVSVAAFALRLACLVLAKPRLRRLLVLDEPFSQLSVEYRPAIRSMLLKLAKDFNIQFIIVTHQPEIICGKVVQL